MRVHALLAWMTLLAPLPALADAQLDQRIEALVADVEASVGDVPVIRADDLRLALGGAAPPVLLDVRAPEERAVSVIPGAVFDADRIAAGAEVIVYCTVGLRSGKTARQLRERGINALNLRGGILAWLAAGGTLVDAQGAPTHRVHVYGRRWNAVPEGFVAVW